MRRGQVMVLAVMMISGAVLSATAAVGILMIYEIRHAGSAINSAEALFAADAGIECALMKDKDPALGLDCGESSPIIFLSNGAEFVVDEVTDASDCAVGTRSTGTSDRIARSFEAYFDNPCP